MRIDAIYRPGIVCVEPDDSLSEAASRMQLDEVGALAVVNDGSLIGIITERDLTRATAEVAPPERTAVARYMSEDPVVVSPQTDVREALTEMIELGVRHLPVCSGRRVLGMISIRDLALDQELVPR